MSQLSQEQFPDVNSGGNKSIRETLLRYLVNLPLFILSMVICVGGVNIFLRYSDKVYQANSQILVGGSNAVSANNTDLVTQGLYGVRSINIDNELELLRSKKLIERVVRKGNFNLRYYNEGTIKRMEMYQLSPIAAEIVEIKDTSNFWSIRISEISNRGGKYEFKDAKEKVFKWNDTLSFPFGRFKIKKRYNNINDNGKPHIIEWNPVSNTADEIRGSLSVRSLSARTTIISLSILSSNPNRAADILNILGYEFTEQDVELKREISVNTLRFIDDRLKVVSSDLRKLDSSKSEIHGDYRFLDAGSELMYYQNKYGQTENRLDEAFIDTAVIRLIEDYVKDDRNKFKKIFSPLGLGDPSLSATIGKYNDLVADRDKAAYENPNDNIIMSSIENNLENMRANVLISLGNVKRAYGLKIQIFNERNNEYNAKMGEIPDKNALELELKKQKELKERLYLYLLQKREETAIAAISSKSNYSTIDSANFSMVPIEPKESQIKTLAFILGLLIPIGILYLIDLMNDKIISRNDITSRSNIAIVGEISHLEGQDELVVNKSRSMIAEQFRIMRSNLQFLLPVTKDTKAKTFLITSTISGEGKSFISTNLAGVLELTGKKVALLEFDLRKLKSLKIIRNEDFNKGITNFLIGQTDDLNDLAYSIDDFPNLHVYKTGPLPPNPSEIMISERMGLLFEMLKESYDYIVIDSSPVGLVSDAFALVQYTDATLFIVRQRYSLKKKLSFINELKESGKLKNMVLVINDINPSGKYGYYGYGYTYGYRNNYGYGGYYGNNYYGAYGKSNKDNNYFDEEKPGFWKRLWSRS